jgi:hypothetical protein
MKWPFWCIEMTMRRMDRHSWYTFFVADMIILLKRRDQTGHFDRGWFWHNWFLCADKIGNWQ